MKITERSHLLLPAIQDFAIKHSLPYYDTNNGRNNGVNLDNDNQCVLIKSKSFDICVVAYKDITIFEDFLQLSSSTIQQLTKTRQFLTDLHGGYDHFENRLKVKINHGKGIVFTIDGSSLMSIEINITDESITVSLKNYAHVEKTIAQLNDYPNIDSALFVALDDFTKLKLLSAGFSSDSISSKEVSNFLNTPLVDLIKNNFSGLSVNVFDRDSLLFRICHDLNVDSNQIFNYKFNQQKTKFVNNTLQIPSTFAHILPEIIKRVVPNHVSKMNQLMNLISLYHYLLGKDFEFHFSSKILHKLNFVKPNEFDVNTNYYNICFQNLIDISIGHNQQPDSAFDPVYLGFTTGNTFKFILWLDYSLDSINKGTRVTEYLTSDVNVIYDKLLASISNVINSKVDNVGNPITSKHLDLYKMLII